MLAVINIVVGLLRRDDSKRKLLALTFQQRILSSHCKPPRKQAELAVLSPVLYRGRWGLGNIDYVSQVHVVPQCRAETLLVQYLLLSPFRGFPKTKGVSWGH